MSYFCIGKKQMLTQEEFENYSVIAYSSSRLRIFIETFIEAHPEVKHLNLTKWDILCAADMSSMFWGCKSLESIDISNWDMSHYDDTANMFGDCTSLKLIKGLSTLNVSNVKSMRFMFCGCKSLEPIDVSNWDVSKVIYMQHMLRIVTH